MCSPAESQDSDLAIYLDYGVDSFFGSCRDIAINHQGLVFRSRWKFPLGTQLALRICARCKDSDENGVCQDVSGLVVGCEALQNRHVQPDLYEHWFKVAVLFIDLAEPAQEDLERLGDQLELGVVG